MYISISHILRHDRLKKLRKITVVVVLVVVIVVVYYSTIVGDDHMIHYKAH